MTVSSSAATTSAQLGTYKVPVAPRHGKVRPLGLAEVRLTGGRWAAYQKRNREATIGHIQYWIEKAGWIGNFDAAAAGTLPGKRRGREFSDSEIYKLLEAMAWELGRADSPDLQAEFDAIVNRVAAAQEPDGYLNTQFGRPGQQPRYSDFAWGHELYCYGHLLQAATARLRTGHHDTLVDIAIGCADHIVATFTDHPGMCGHPELEMALVEFGRALGRRDYIDQARLFVDRRGHGWLPDIEWGRSYYQDDAPVRQATTFRGHAVRALYLASGVVDVADETGDDELLKAVVAQWETTISRRTYLTGAMGARHQDEAFGDDFVLPSDRCYGETCAAVATLMAGWRLLLATGDASYGDMIERVLYNVISTAIADDGRSFFYTNTLHQRTSGSVPDADSIVPRSSSSLRAPWFEVSCCPPNIARTIASLAAYVATVSDAGLQLHQYADADIDTVLPDGRAVQLTVRTDYPASGVIDIRSTGPDVGEWELAVRIPHWAAGATLTDPAGNRQQVSAHALVRKAFAPGDTVRLELNVAPRITVPDERIDAVRGCVAVERGPVVLCVESADLPHGASVDQLRIAADQQPVALDDPSVWNPGDPIRPVATVRGELVPTGDRRWPYSSSSAGADAPVGQPITIPLVPYYRWANRGPGTMRIFVPVEPAVGSTPPGECAPPQ